MFFILCFTALIAGLSFLHELAHYAALPPELRRDVVICIGHPALPGIVLIRDRHLTIRLTIFPISGAIGLPTYVRPSASFLLAGPAVSLIAGAALLTAAYLLHGTVPVRSVLIASVCGTATLPQLAEALTYTGGCVGVCQCVINLLPLPGSDGYHLYSSNKQKN
ncbi:hypothetical protein [Oryzomonas rubra]|uniref:Uncharacterized protein n=1 Tax=Oryzomonas rubra TaxID=2509454 RepID=A0A5A9X5L1_9BACT|nr:hypothetical protein [Oryzomonas rubra]KAA0888074.1 hypothetical protein ET418_16880 [Oryzomonas rubra]